jgi:hypothetical protein
MDERVSWGEEFNTRIEGKSERREEAGEVGVVGREAVVDPEKGRPAGGVGVARQGHRDIANDVVARVPVGREEVFKSQSIWFAGFEEGGMAGGEAELVEVLAGKGGVSLEELVDGIGGEAEDWEDAAGDLFEGAEMLFTFVGRDRLQHGECPSECRPRANARKRALF